MIFDNYKDPDADSVLKLDDACEDYNDSMDVEFQEESESESESEDNKEPE